MVSNIWNPLGLKSSPFFQEPLDASDKGWPPISLFVGRAAEAEEVTGLVTGSGAGSSRLVVSGLPGSGKTTFIQYVKTLLAAQGYAVSSRICRVPHRLDVVDFGIELLRAVVSDLGTYLSAEVIKSLDRYDDARRLVFDTQRHSVQANLSIMGFGGGGGTSTTDLPPAYSPTQFFDAISRLTRSAQESGVQGVVVHLNNLENLEENPDVASILMRDARDYFMIPGLHILMGAALDFYGAVIAGRPQVRSIFPAPLRFGSLEIEEVKELLTKRYEYFRVGDMELTPPVSWELVEDFHRLFHGDLRGMLLGLEETCRNALGSTGSAPLDQEQAYLTLAPLYQRELTQELSEASLGHLRTLTGCVGEEFRQADVVPHIGISQSGVSKLFKELERARAIVHLRTDGPSRFFTLSGRARIAAGLY